MKFLKKFKKLIGISEPTLLGYDDDELKSLFHNKANNGAKFTKELISLYPPKTSLISENVPS